MGSTPILASIVLFIVDLPCLGGEMVDTQDLKSCGRKAVRVRFPPQAPTLLLSFTMIPLVKLIWQAMLGSVFLYTALGYAFSSKLIPFQFPDFAGASTLSMVLAAVAGVSLALAYILPSRLTQSSLLNRAILQMTLLEWVGILGLLYVLLTADFPKAMIFFGASILGFFLTVPKQDQAH